MQDAIPVGIWESRRVEDCEKGWGGSLLATMRAIVLHDQSVAQVAMVRWGSRDRQRIVPGKGKQKPRVVNKVVPISKHHTEEVRRDFLEGLGHLVRAVGRYMTVE